MAFPCVIGVAVCWTLARTCDAGPRAVYLLFTLAAIVDACNILRFYKMLMCATQYSATFTTKQWARLCCCKSRYHVSYCVNSPISLACRCCAASSSSSLARLVCSLHVQCMSCRHDGMLLSKQPVWCNCLRQHLSGLCINCSAAVAACFSSKLSTWSVMEGCTLLGRICPATEQSTAAV